MKYDDYKTTVFYKKEGDDYVPVSEYNREFSEALPKGVHLILCHPAGRSISYNIDPDYAALIAASKVAEEAISKEIVKATDLRLNSNIKKPLTPSQKEAWENLVKEFGESARQLEWPSAREAAQAGVRAMEEEAKKMFTNPAVKKAYEHFITVYKLTKENSDE